MSYARVLLLLCAAAAGVHYWHHHESAVHFAPVVAAADDYGFVGLPPAQGQNADTVYVVAAVNCPHAAAQRADRLAEELRDEGIPVIRTDHVRFLAAGLDESTANRLNAIMTGPLPIVFVHGRAKSAATLDDVESEFRSSDGRDL